MTYKPRGEQELQENPNHRLEPFGGETINPSLEAAMSPPNQLTRKICIHDGHRAAPMWYGPTHPSLAGCYGKKCRYLYRNDYESQH